MARLHLIRETDIHNTYWGIATSLWFNGCPHRCKGCWNNDTWEIDSSLEINNRAVIAQTLMALDDPISKHLSILGGEPLMPSSNLDDFIEIVSMVKKFRPKTKVLCWTGYRMEYLLKHDKFLKALDLIDVLIDGRYDQSKSITGKKYGSTNQRVIDVQKSLYIKEVCLAPENYEI